MIAPPPPAELGYLTEAIGAEATLALIEARAGTRIYVQAETSGAPRGGRPPESLAGIVGAKAAAALAQSFGGCYIRVPSAKRWRAQVYWARGMTRAAIALKLGLGEDAVRKMLLGKVGARANSGQTPRRRGEPRPFLQTELPI